MEMETSIAMRASERNVEFGPLTPCGGRTYSFQSKALKFQKYIGFCLVEEGFGGFWIDAH